MQHDADNDTDNRNSGDAGTSARGSAAIEAQLRSVTWASAMEWCYY